MAGNASGIADSRIWPSFVRLVVLAGLAIAIALSGSGGDRQTQAAAGEPFLVLHSVVELADRPVCSLLDAVPSEAHILGQDGGTSVEADGHVFWSFNDTWVLKPDGVHMLIPNNIASTDDHEASDCVALTSQTADGYAVPTIDRLPDELGAFPSGMISVQPGFVHFFYASAVYDPNVAGRYRVRGVGLARFDTATGTGQRLLAGQLIWNDDSFPGAHLDEALALVHDGYVYTLLRLTLGGQQAGTMLARTPAAQLEAAKFEYWNGASWSSVIPDVSTPEAANQALLWVQPRGMNDPGIAYNDFLQKWTAVYTSGLVDVVETRVADDITGPWSEEAPTQSIDCSRFLPQPQHSFACYLAQQHPEYEKDGGRTIYVTWSNFGAYEVYLHELRLATPIYQWTDKDGRADYLVGTSEEQGYSQDGIGFYASDIPVPGFAAIHRWEESSSGTLRLAAQAPSGTYGDAGIAFYAPLDRATADATNALYAPVYRWSNGQVDRYSALDLRPAGFTVQERAFYAACPDSDRDGSSDCQESFESEGWATADSDGDGLNDRYETETAGCDLMIPNDDKDGIDTVVELALGATNPCVWDSGYWGCDNAPVRDPNCDRDTDGDRCRDAWELGPNPRFGGERNPGYPWDYFNPTGDGRNRVDDVLAVLSRYFISTGDPGYSPAIDRGGFTGPNPWDLAPPDGRIRVDDILAAVRSYLQDCP